MTSQLNLVAREMHAIMAILQKPSRSQWGNHIPTEDSDPLLRSFADLSEVFNTISDLNDVNPQVYITPFLDVIAANKPNSSAVERSLIALSRFLNANIIPDDGIKIVRVSEDIAKAITKSKFVVTDNYRDEDVLVASLGVMSAIISSPCGSFLTNEAVCDILQCCFRIRFDGSNSSSVHKRAEETLNTICSVMFSRLPTFTADYRHPYMKKYLKISLNKTKPKPKPKDQLVNEEPAETPQKEVAPPIPVEANQSQEPVETPVNVAVEEVPDLESNNRAASNEPLLPSPEAAEEGVAQSVGATGNEEFADIVEERISPEPEEDGTGSSNTLHIPYGLPAVREFLRFLAGLMDSSDQSNPDPFVLLGVELYTTSLISGAEYIAQSEFLMKLVKDNLSYHLLKLLDSTELSIFDAANEAWLLMIRYMRGQLKFQIERYFIRVGQLISSDMLNVTNELKKVALTSLVRLFCIPHLIQQLFLCYDLSYYSSDVFKDIVKILHDNVFSASGILETRNILALDALAAIVNSFLVNSHQRSDSEPIGLERYLDYSPAERLKRKEIIRNASKEFNRKPKSGIEVMRANKMFPHDPPKPEDIAQFLLVTPYLDKKQIGLYLCNRENPSVLAAYVKLFKFEDTRLDQALRAFLDSFRLPGEAAEIAKILQEFSDYWYEANNCPFAHKDAAFTLAYAVIMLNTDQHNPQVRRNQTVMDAAAFKRNLSGTNGGKDLDEALLDEIFIAIKENEIMIPTEHSGPIRDTYEWQILLRKGEEEENKFVDHPIHLEDSELFQICWGHVSSALFFVVDKSETVSVISKALNCYRMCIKLAARNGMSEVTDNLIIHLCKFSSIFGAEALHDKDDDSGNRMLLSYRAVEEAVITFSENRKGQLALACLFEMVHAHGDRLRESWRNVIDIIVQLYRAQLLPFSVSHVEDFVSPKGYINISPQYNHREADNRNEGGLLSWLGFAAPEHPMKHANEKAELREAAMGYVAACHPEYLFNDSKYYVLSSLSEFLDHIFHAVRTMYENGSKFKESGNELPKQYEEMIVFLTEFSVNVVIENKDRLSRVWEKVRAQFEFLISSFGRNTRIPQRAVVGLLRITNRNLFRIKDEISNDVLESLSLLFKLHPPGLFMFSRDIAFGLYQLLRANAANVHNAEHWRTLFALLESVGAAVYPDEIVDAHRDHVDGRATDSELISKPKFCNERGYASDDAVSNTPRQKQIEHGTSTQSVGSVGRDWIHVSNTDLPADGSQPPKSKVFERGTIVLVPTISRHDPHAFIKVTETLVFLVRDAAHITPENFESCVQCLRSMIEASLDGGRNAAGVFTDEHKPTQSEDGKPQMSAHELHYYQASHQLLDITYNLHLKVFSMFTDWAVSDPSVPADIPYLWEHCWCPLIQAIARLCCDSRRQVRTLALTTLARALLIPQFFELGPQQWEKCFADVLFPLLLKLLDGNTTADPADLEETRVRVIQLTAKVLLNHLIKLIELKDFDALFLRVLEFMRRYWNCERSELLKEAIPESLKNMLLVVDNATIFYTQPQLYERTCEDLKRFLPHLVDEVMLKLPVKCYQRIPEPLGNQVAMSPTLEEKPEVPEAPSVDRTREITPPQELYAAHGPGDVSSCSDRSPRLLSTADSFTDVVTTTSATTSSYDYTSGADAYSPPAPQYHENSPFSNPKATVWGQIPESVAQTVVNNAIASATAPIPVPTAYQPSSPPATSSLPPSSPPATYQQVPHQQYAGYPIPPETQNPAYGYPYQAGYGVQSGVAPTQQTAPDVTHHAYNASSPPLASSPVQHYSSVSSPPTASSPPVQHYSGVPNPPTASSPVQHYPTVQYGLENPLPIPQHMPYIDPTTGQVMYTQDPAYMNQQYAAYYAQQQHLLQAQQQQQQQQQQQPIHPQQQPINPQEQQSTTNRPPI
uniref:SEC7 domain-containing protein n=1 Tax=Panagrellus redivivus TaxID=6233 RepID=A0A7E4ZYQ2_PANRE